MLGSESPGRYVAVCRFYIPPELGDSHFFSASQSECDDTQRKFPRLVLESPSVFHVLALPDPADPDLRENGGCPPGTRAVYRLWNNRADSNHFYTDDKAERAAFIAKGYVPEGARGDGAVFCS